VLKEHVIKSCRHLLRPVVRFLLRQGVTWEEFSNLSKDSYVEVARREYGIQGRPTNNARVAMLTGLSRREVARVRDQLIDADRGADVNEREGNRLSKVLTGWHVDKEFLGDDDRPKDLTATGPTGSLSSLLKRYAGDLPHSAVRKEMVQRGLVQELDDGGLRVMKRDYVYSNIDPDIVRQMGVALHDHAQTLDHNLNEERLTDPRFEGMADNPAVSVKAVKAFQKLLQERGLAFLEEIDAWLSGQDTDQSNDDAGRKVRLGVGIYLIHDEI
jgi:hypothetical protein